MFLVKLVKNIFSESPLGIAMTLSFLASVVYTLKCFAQDTQIFVLFISLFAVIIMASRFVNAFSYKMCDYLAKHAFVGHNNEHVFEKKPKALKKVADQCWQLFLHVSSLSFELPLIFGQTWWSDPSSCFSPCPCKQNPTLAVKLVYAYESAAYIFEGFLHRFWNARKHDYNVMFLHHIVTAILIAGSYSYNYFAFGTIVMFLHDVSDLPVDMLVITNQLNVEGREWFYIVELTYLWTTIQWFIVRIVLFPIKLLKPLIGVPAISECFPHGTHMFYFLEVMLYCLYSMHYYWLYVFLRIGYDILTMPVEANRGASYEGEEKKED